MKKWIIGGIIIGMIGPILSPAVGGIIFRLENEAFLLWDSIFHNVMSILFPIGLFPMGFTSSQPFNMWLNYIICSLVNIGMYAFLGLIVGKIAKESKGVKLKHLILMLIVGFLWQNVACAFEGYEIGYGGRVTGYYSNEPSSSTTDYDSFYVDFVNPAKSYTSPRKTLIIAPIVTIILEDTLNPGNHSAVKIGHTIYDVGKINKLFIGEGIGRRRDYNEFSFNKDVYSNNKEIIVTFLSLEQILQLESNLKLDEGKKFHYIITDNSCVNYLKDHFGRVGATYPNNFIDTPKAMYLQTIEMNKTYITPIDWFLKGQQYETSSFDLHFNIIKGIEKFSQIMAPTLTPTFAKPFSPFIPIAPVTAPIIPVPIIPPTPITDFSSGF